MSQILLDLILALPPFLFGMAVTWRVIWPRWKVPGKAAAYLSGVAALSFFFGHWSVLVAWLHQSVGLFFHYWFCRKHGFTWHAVEDPARYIALSKALVGVSPRPDDEPHR